MNITIKSLSGSGINFSVQVNPSDDVATLKIRICEIEGIPVDQQILIFCGRELANECTFTEYNIQKDSTVHLALKTVKVGRFYYTSFKDVYICMYIRRYGIHVCKCVLVLYIAELQY